MFIWFIFIIKTLPRQCVAGSEEQLFIVLPRKDRDYEQLRTGVYA